MRDKNVCYMYRIHTGTYVPVPYYLTGLVTFLFRIRTLETEVRIRIQTLVPIGRAYLHAVL